MMASLFMVVICGFFVFVFFMVMISGKSVMLEWEIFSLGSAYFTFPLLLDMVSVSFSSIVWLISTMVVVYSSAYMSEDLYLSRFIWMVVLFVVCMSFFILVPSLLGVMIGWDGLGITSFILVIYYQNKKSASSGMITVLTNRIGDCLLIMSIALLGVQGHWGMWSVFDSEITWIVVLLVFLGSITKSAQFPFCSWLPAAMAAPTPVSSLVHSSTLVTAGVFLMFRFSGLLEGNEGCQSLVIFLSCCTLVLAGVGAIFETDLKKVIALSTLSQLGMMMLSLGILMPWLALFHLFSHALFKALLFLCAGVMIHNNMGSQDARMFGNVWKMMPMTVVLFNISNLALCGVPFFNGFFSKDLILEGYITGSIGYFTLFMVFLGTMSTVFYSLRLSFMILTVENNGGSFHSMNDESLSMWGPMLMMVGGAVVGSQFLQSMIVEFDDEVFLDSSFVILALLFGATMSFFTIYVLSLYNKMKSSGYSMFNFFLSYYSNMWFLSHLSSYPWVDGMLMSSQFFHKSLDQGWVEIIGGTGSFILIESFSSMLYKWQNQLFTFIFMYGVFILILFWLFLF
uniref:NADH-ubiquinone oxidoreductase chain 5 n=1 Tax=Cuspidaria undata TaxID=2952366 RepID=A0AAT9T5K5_9BIVA|nr:NADH dehydrogenase subunit 5 [Cuspidaria undata]USF19209.1 NADH dehydrogenase subunit 5 [Cuspidaria undata]